MKERIGTKQMSAEIGKTWAQRIMERTEQAAEDVGLTATLTLKRVKEGLNAKEVQAHYDKEAGWVYSKRLTAHRVRLEAAKIASNVLGLKHPETLDVTTGGEAIRFDSISPEERELILEASRAVQRVKDGKP